MSDKLVLDERKHQTIFKAWELEARNKETDFQDFVNRLDSEYVHDYGSSVYAIYAIMLAAFTNYQTGLTGFQSSCLGWMLVQEFLTSTKDAPLKLMNYHDMLYPQYESSFQKTVSKDVFDYLQRSAKNKLEEVGTHVAPRVKEHWESIANGNLPFDYVLEEK